MNEICIHDKRGGARNLFYIKIEIALDNFGKQDTCTWCFNIDFVTPENVWDFLKREKIQLETRKWTIYCVVSTNFQSCSLPEI